MQLRPLPNAVSTSPDETSPDEISPDETSPDQTSHANQGTTGMLALMQLTPAHAYIAVLKAFHRFYL